MSDASGLAEETDIDVVGEGEDEDDEEEEDDDEGGGGVSRLAVPAQRRRRRRSYKKLSSSIFAYIFTIQGCLLCTLICPFSNLIQLDLSWVFLDSDRGFAMTRMKYIVA